MHAHRLESETSIPAVGAATAWVVPLIASALVSAGPKHARVPPAQTCHLKAHLSCCSKRLFVGPGALLSTQLHQYTGRKAPSSVSEAASQMR